jgi:hypothetical protein
LSTVFYWYSGVNGYLNYETESPSARPTTVQLYRKGFLTR